ncbi:glycoside hydrolase family 73 protein [Capnocytophaga canimorsus]|uniref:glycoside hydrolase family 73 protein n=1 Tax=Capnocytophaga canimorsus TaxID=28188 RepID=UPI00249E43E2|nr:glucosaminidase domain-containing protein [Capnocytophaga canimorsus]WGU68279.1 glucosaminidase domain-containing protein [Capnocytophaga canimorsus]
MKTIKTFVEKYKNFALSTEQKTGIKAVFTLAQAGLESGWGKSAPGNMFFGVKATKSTPKDKRQLLRTTEVLSSPNVAFPEIISVTQRPDGRYRYVVKDWFVKYDSPEDCFTNHANFFLKNKRYAKALAVKHDPYKFAEEIAKAGYATAPNYAESLKKTIQVIEKYV